MATIAGRNVGAFRLPENDSRQQNVSVGQAADGSFKFYKFRASDRLITIVLVNKTTTLKNLIGSDLEGDADYTIAIVPDSHVDLGAGAGTSINAKWIDRQFNAVKVTHDSWTITLNFIRVV